MLIVAIAWIYVVLMMSLTEASFVAGVMTFLTYGVLPLSVILYVMGSPQRKRKRKAADITARDATKPGPTSTAQSSDTTQDP